MVYTEKEFHLLTYEIFMQHLPEKIKAVYDIFKEYYSEERIDLQIPYCSDYEATDLYHMLEIYIPANSRFRDRALYKDISEKDIKELKQIITNYFITNKDNLKSYILVKFKDLIVTNEENCSVKIDEIFASIGITSSGTYVGIMEWLRTIFTEEHINAHYAHSHLNSDVLEWQNPCLGTGPIVKTISSLRDKFSEDLWRLFCLELDNCISTESLAGGPYMRLSEIGISDSKILSSTLTYDEYSVLNDFSEKEYTEIIKNVIYDPEMKIVYSDNHYKIGLPLYKTILLIAKHIILNCSKETLEKIIDSFITVYIADGILNISKENARIDLYEKELSNVNFKLIFKKQFIKPKIIHNTKPSENNRLFIPPLPTIFHFKTSIESQINYYGTLQDYI